MEYIFESTKTAAETLSYVEMYNDMWSVHVCSCVDFDSFISYNIFWRNWQTGANFPSYAEH